MNNPLKSKLVGALMLGLLLPLGTALPAVAGPDEDAVSALLTKMFDKPESKLMFGPIIVVGDNAIADWYQGEMGGRALLWKKNGQWALRLCSGDALKDAKLLASNGIAEADAAQLAQNLASAEASTDPTIAKKFSLFEGTMVMDGGQ
ncbi:MAG: copper uptake system-associated protein [Hyphomicrobiales bacterium]